MSENYPFDVQFIEKDLCEVELKTVDLISNPSRLDTLFDVGITNPEDGQILQYNETTGKWENSSLSLLVSSYIVNNEEPTLISGKTYSSAHNFIANTIMVFLNGIKEKNIIVNSANTFTFDIDIDIEVTDTIEISYIKDN